MAAMRVEGVKPLQPLEGEQLHASDPGGDVWLSASAGTGKTHVLTARVLRLLLKQGVDPSTILCLTFTKAGAAEMAERVQSRLAHWVRLEDAALRKELFNLGEAHDDPATLARARTLFARVLEVPGGLRIGTIHAFAGQLLASFPGEAGLTPGFRPIEAREEALLARRTLAELVLTAEARGDSGLTEALARIALRLGEGGAEAWLRRCARAADVLVSLPEPLEPWVRRMLDLPEGDIAAAMGAACGKAPFDGDCLRRLMAANRGWGTATGHAQADAIEAWLASDPEGRAGSIDALAKVVLTDKGERRQVKPKLLDAEPDYHALADALAEACAGLRRMRDGAEMADLLSAGLSAGRAYAIAYAEAKRSAGLVDFDDLIARVARLLAQPGVGEWIRYQLDQTTDHILVDEAQDTNARQWAIIVALTTEFFAGAGARGGRSRTLFTVGDHKQAIFGFQGTDPSLFGAFSDYFGALAGGREGADGTGDAGLRRLSLSRSYRSAPAVLEAVDAMIAEVAPAALGLDDRPPPHLSAVGGAGLVELWPPVTDDGDEVEADGGEEGWVNDATRRLATGIAEQVARWIRDGEALNGITLRPEHVMILVRRRGALASLLVARLHAAGVPVAGVDRLRLAAPLAVKDLLAAARFAVQPEDSLTLASLLVSPLFGWTQERLRLAAARPDGASFWRQLRTLAGETETAERLAALLSMADLGTPYQYFETILSGPMRGRHALLERLGREAADPIDELLNAALAFERTGTAGLQRFLDWFDRDDVEIVRDPSQPLDAVRVMTVHGAKGLQAPLVILADATVDPERSPRRDLMWQADEDRDPLPLFRPKKAELTGSLLRDAEQADARDRQEHWRLLYVAATRAERRLVVAGALGPAAKGEAPEASWHAAMARALNQLGATGREDPHWGWVLEHRGVEPAEPRSTAKPTPAPPPSFAPRPDWLDRSAPEEARPPRPLTPSAIGEDRSSDPPPGPAMRQAAERGRLLHQLFERLPAVAPGRRHAAALPWLEGAGGVVDPDLRTALADDACRVIDDPRFAAIFSADALAEAPLAAVVDGRVIAGTVDRLLIGDDSVRIVDFKTGRRVPGSIEEAPLSHRTQMAAYAAALSAIFPGRRVEAALLYTHGPVLLPLPADMIAALHPSEVERRAAVS